MHELDLAHGIQGLLLSLIGVIGAKVVTDIVKGIYSFVYRNRKPTREEFKELISALRSTEASLGSQKLITEKMSHDIRRIYLFLKIMAGDKWPRYRKQVEEIEKEEKERNL